MVELTALALIASAAADVALIVTAIGVLLGSLASVLIAVGNRRKIVETNRGVQEVHVLVDGRLSTVLARVDQLTAALEGSDTEVPPEPATGAGDIAARAIEKLTESKPQGEQT